LKANIWAIQEEVLKFGKIQDEFLEKSFSSKIKWTENWKIFLSKI